MTDTTVSTNAAGQQGGGIFNTGTAQLTRVTLDHNSSPRGAGIYNEGQLDLDTSTLSDNTATYHGGAVYQAGGTLTARFSTVADNTAEDGSAIYLDQGQRGNTKFMGVAVSGGVCCGGYAALRRQQPGERQHLRLRPGQRSARYRPAVAAAGCQRRPRRARACPRWAARSRIAAAPPAPARISAARSGRSAMRATSARWRWWRCRSRAAPSWRRLRTRPSAAAHPMRRRATGSPCGWRMRAASKHAR